MMTKRRGKGRTAMDKAAPAEKAREPGYPEGEGQDCRCKEMSEKTLTGLLKTAADDLAFWKKGKRRRPGKDEPGDPGR